MWSGVWKMYFDLNGPSSANINSTPPHSSERVLRVDLGVVFQQELDHGFVFVVAFCVPSLLLDLVSGYIRVETEAPPAGDLRRRSGRSPGRGSPVGNLKPPAITETPVLAGAPDKTGDF